VTAFNTHFLKTQEEKKASALHVRLFLFFFFLSSFGTRLQGFARRHRRGRALMSDN